MSGPGYQGSDKSGAEVIFYAHGDDPVFSIKGVRGPIKLVGAAKTFSNPDLEQDQLLATLHSSAVSNLTWTKTFGMASGRWSMDIKTLHPELLTKALNDDDWVDIVFTQHAKKFHVCRGMIDTIRENRSVNSGATVKTFKLSGRDHGKPFEVTPLFFNRFIGENAFGGDAKRAYQIALNNTLEFGSAVTNVRLFLLEYLNMLVNNASATWSVPPGVPGLTAGTTFYDAVGAFFEADGFKNYPPRLGFNPSFLMGEEFAGHTLWDLAHEWSDPSFTELFVDLVRKDTHKPPKPGEELRPEDSAMAVIFRDKPFPNQTMPTDSLYESPWFSLPMHIVNRQEITDSDEGRGGDDRFNTFFVRIEDSPEQAGGHIDLTKQLWDPTDVSKRGIRRMDVSTHYVPMLSEIDILSFVGAHRALLRDWYGLNAYYANGTLVLGHGRPDIRLGSRIRIPGHSKEEDQTYYVEGVTHAWSLGQMRTTLTVTRGWTGTDQQLMQEITELPSRFVLPGDLGT